MSYLNSLVAFPTFFNLSLKFATKNLGSRPPLAPSLVFVDCIELLHLWLQQYNSSDFSINLLVMSMCRVVSCVVGRGCWLWPLPSLGKTLLAFALLHFVPQGQTCLLLQVSLTSYCIPASLSKNVLILITIVKLSTSFILRMNILISNINFTTNKKRHSLGCPCH